jgi:hypothetical protein
VIDDRESWAAEDRAIARLVNATRALGSTDQAALRAVVRWVRGLTSLTTPLKETTMRTITDHHDGHDLTESIVIEADALDPANGGASHHYVVQLDGLQLARIQFWQGPRQEPWATPGVLDSVLLAIVIDRMRSFQDGPLASRENALVRTHCEEALMWLKHRADDRAKRGVLGKAVK